MNRRSNRRLALAYAALAVAFILAEIATYAALCLYKGLPFGS